MFPKSDLTRAGLEFIENFGIWCHFRLNDENEVQTFNYCAIPYMDVCQCLVVHTSMDSMSKNKPITSMTLVACESKLRSVVMSSINPCTGNWVAIGCTVLQHDRAISGI